MPRRTARDDDPTLVKLLEMLREMGVRDDDLSKIEALFTQGAEDEPPEFPGRPRPGGASDAHFAYDMAATSPGRTLQNMRAALAETEPFVGQILAADSAAGVFREALGRLGVRATGVHESGLPELFRAHRRSRAGGASASGSMQRQPMQFAGRGSADFAKRHPEAARIRVI